MYSLNQMVNTTHIGSSGHVCEDQKHGCQMTLLCFKICIINQLQIEVLPLAHWPPIHTIF